MPIRNVDDEVHRLHGESLRADFVTTDSGTGIVHHAPAFGEVDFDVLVEREQFASLQT